MEDTSDPDDWVHTMFRITRPRILDACNLIGFDRYSERAGTFLVTFLRLPAYICENGIAKAVHWIVDRHPREIALILLMLLIAHSVPSDMPIHDLWTFNYARSLFASAKHMADNHTRPLETSPMYRRLSVGVIPDGNRRWGRAKGIGSHGGHFYGSARVMECIRSCITDTRVGHLVVYVMSYDNLQKRSPSEQRCLLAILKGWMTELHWLRRARLIDVRVCGEPSGLVRACIGDIPINPASETTNESYVPTNRPLNVSLLLGYDGRREIQQAKGDPTKLWVRDDLDGVIRSGNTRRASGFCTYQTGYSEWHFIDEMWPDVDCARFTECVTMIEKSVGLQNHGK